MIDITEKENYTNEYRRWLEEARLRDDEILLKELESISGDQKSIQDSFYCDLHFGTGGLRGVMGAGTNRMNIYTVAKASQGLADYISEKYDISAAPRIAISYDSRHNSELFARTAAEVFAANNIKVKIYKNLMPTPCLSYAIRALGCGAGVMITASHNSSEYNGYKVYNEDGCQITTKSAADIYEKIKKIDIFSNVRKMNFQDALGVGAVSYIPDAIYESYIRETKKQSVLYGDKVDKNVSIVYSPLNGTGLKPVLRILEECEFTNVSVVAEQEQPDGDFPTCPYPNPEAEAAMKLGMGYAEKNGADLLIATDPDCDRVGIAVKDNREGMRLLTANETGVLLLDFICSQKIKHNKMPDAPVMMKTIVTTDMAERIASDYGVKTINVLTGFKFIGEQIGYLEKNGNSESFIFGFEESYGYLAGTHVRDKDAVVGTLLICEMFTYYKTRGISLSDRLEELYRKYGYCYNIQQSYKFEGYEGQKKINKIMDHFRSNVNTFAGKKVKTVFDYMQGLQGLPQSNVLKFVLEGDCSFAVRPSGTEPKLKVYMSIMAADRDSAKVMENKMKEEMTAVIKKAAG